MSNKVVILQSNYIPWKGYFDLINDADIFVFYDEVQYTKNDWRNRNKIYSVNGEQWLTIPISKEAVKLKISEVQLESPSWQRMHHKSITYAYTKAPYFSSIKSLLDDVYLEKEWNYLVQVNRYLIEKISDMIGITTKFIDSKELDLQGNKVQRLINILKQLNASTYISGPSAKDYLSGYEHLFAENNIELIYKNYSNYPAYRQLSYPFTHAVSVVDLIVNVGPDYVKDFIWNKKDNEEMKSKILIQ